MGSGRLRVGLIGAGPGGWGAVAHVPALRALPEFELAAVCTTRAETAEAAARAHGVGKWFDDPARLVADPDIDIVSVCVRVTEHAALVRAALEAGKHVYCEWPLASNTAEAAELAELARRVPGRAAIGLQARYAPALNQVRELIADGLVGRVVSTAMSLSAPWSTKFVYNQDRASGGNLLPILGGHALDGLCSVFGEFESLVATASVQSADVEVRDVGWVRRTAPDHIAASGLLAGGVFASFLLLGGPSHGTGYRWEIHGSEGDLVLLPGNGGGSVQRAELVITHVAADGTARTLEIPAGSEHYREAPSGAPFNVAQSYAAFGESIRNGTPFAADFEHAVRRHRTIDAIYRAADSGQRQVLPA